MATFSRANAARFSFVVDGNEWRVADFTLREQMSAPFELQIGLVTEEEAQLADCVGKTALLTIESTDQDRYLHGIVQRFTQTGVDGRFFLYQARVVPQLWLLSLTRDCRIYQNKSVPDIVKETLERSRLTSDLFAFRLQGTYLPREYCVQYRESDLDFISRLLEEEGIFYFFEHSNDKHRLVFGDGAVNYLPIAGEAEVVFNPGDGLVAEEEAVIGFHLSRQIRTGKYTLRDFNFEKPSVDLTAENEDKENTQLEAYDYPGEYTTTGEGLRLAQIRLQEAILFKERADGKSVVPRLTPGSTFTLRDHLVESCNQEYLLTSVVHKGAQPQVLEEKMAARAATSYENTFEAIPSAVTFRPERTTPKPVVEGVQTAIVTGPSGEEIYPDKHGRVKVQFHWDRLGNKDESSSCWMRVSQLWAGAGWGAMFIPRIGQEVIVDFIEGDPDRPIITGRVYHGTNTPPYPLPAEKTKSTIKSDSSSGHGGFNELRFEDKKGDEEIYLQGQKDWNILIKNDKAQNIGHDETLAVGNNRTKSVEKDQGETIGQNKTISVGKHHNETIGENVTRTTGKNESVSIGENSNTSVGKDDTLNIGGKSDVSVGKEASITVGKDMTTTVGKSSVTQISEDMQITVGKKLGIQAADAITIDSDRQLVLSSGSASITLKKNGDITIKGNKITISASGNLVLKGSKVTAN